MCAEGEVMRSAVLGDVLHDLALAPAVDQLQNLVADQLEGVAVGPAGTVVVPWRLERRQGNVMVIFKIQI